MTLSNKNKVDIYKLDNANTLLNSSNRQYFDYSSKRNNNFKFASSYSKSNLQFSNENENDNSGLDLQQVIDHLKFISKQRRKPLRIDPYASKLLGLPNYCDYLCNKSNGKISSKKSSMSHK